MSYPFTDFNYHWVLKDFLFGTFDEPGYERLENIVKNILVEITATREDKSATEEFWIPFDTIAIGMGDRSDFIPMSELNDDIILDFAKNSHKEDEITALNYIFTYKIYGKEYALANNPNSEGHDYFVDDEDHDDDH
jgi:hypothetical protein